MPKLQKSKQARKTYVGKAYVTRRNHRARADMVPYNSRATRISVHSKKQPIEKELVMAEARRGRTEIISSSGFTHDALSYVKRYRPRMTLIHAPTKNGPDKKRRKK